MYSRSGVTIEFLSTHSVRSATAIAAATHSAVVISIHALRKECDLFDDVPLENSFKISIHALRKECDLETMR